MSYYDYYIPGIEEDDGSDYGLEITCDPAAPGENCDNEDCDHEKLIMVQG